jgi:dTDP-4-dehydrorhamnose 3,5-epimerase
MKVERTRIPDLLVLEPRAHTDNRGLLWEIYSTRRYEEAGVTRTFVQDVHSFSREGVIRGFHYQIHRPQAKLVMVLRGRVFDVAVDIRRGSPTFGLWMPTLLSAEKRNQLFVPEGFAHGFCALEDSDVLYKCSDHYSPEHERGIAHDDPSLAVPWPVDRPILSERDRDLPLLSQLTEADLPTFTTDSGVSDR